MRFCFNDEKNIYGVTLQKHRKIEKKGIQIILMNVQ